MFQPGLQTHFPNGRIEPRFIEAVADRVYWCRMDVQHATRETSLEIFGDILALKRRPFVTCWDGDESSWFAPSDQEYQNERTILLNGVPPIPGEVYRRNWEQDFYPKAKAAGHTVYFGAAANFEDRDLTWYRRAQAGTLPPDVRCSIHDYWTGSEAELIQRLHEWRTIIGMDRDYLISECGAHIHLAEAQAAYMARKWRFWQGQEHCLGLVYFQIFDDVENDITMGLYAGHPAHGEPPIKQVVFDTFPRATEDYPMSGASSTPLFVFDHNAVIHNADGTKSLRWDLAGMKTDASKDRVFSLQSDGTVQDRPLDQIGPWERGTVEGDRLVFRADNARAVFAWQA